MYKIFLFIVITFYTTKYILYRFSKKTELEHFRQMRSKDNICSRPFIVRGKASNYSRLLNLDKKIDELELIIMKKRRENMQGKLNTLDKKYKWMYNHHKAKTDPNSSARKRQNEQAKKAIRNNLKNAQKNAKKEFSNKYKNAFFDALNSGKSLPRVMPNLSGKFSKTMGKYGSSRDGNRAKRKAKNKASKKIREGEDDLWEPIKSIVKLINDGKENKMKSDFKKNDNAPGVGNLNYGSPSEGKNISNNKFSGAYA